MELKVANIHDALNNPNTARDVAGFEGLYKITYNGMVYSYIKNKFLRPGLAGMGYLTVALRTGNNKRRTHYIHKMIANAFIPNPENKRTVNHKNGIKTFNHVSNLEHLTHGENNSHAIRTGLKKSIHPARGIIQLTMDGKEIARYRTSEDPPPPFHSGCICKVANGKMNQHAGFKWKFIN